MTAAEASYGDKPGSFDLIVILASLGGMGSSGTVLAGLPADFPVPIVLLQHAAPRHSPEVLPELLQRATDLPVRTACDGDKLAGPGVYVLPRGCTASIDAERRLRLVTAERGAGGDELLSSAADAAASRAIAVVLTGMLNDGANGVRAIKRKGGRVLVEDPRTARASSMPTHAIATGCVDFSLPNHRLASALITLVMAPGGAEMFAMPTPAWATLDG